MLDRKGLSATGDVTLLLVAVLSFSLFFASLAGAYVTRQDRERGERLEAAASSLLAAFLDDPRWTDGHGVINRGALSALPAGPVDALAAGHPFRVTVWDVVTDGRWTLEGGTQGGDRRTAATSARIAGATVDPARVTATVWGP